MTELPARMNMPQRLASLTRFREKRKERCYDKRIRYTVRKEVAQRWVLVVIHDVIFTDFVLFLFLGVSRLTINRMSGSD
jgi:hypothetical protein